MKYNLNK